jgi:transcriptional regulator with XRE-family HTH domain
MTMSDQLRRIIDESGLSRYRIAKDIGLDESTLSKFYNGQGGLSMEVLDRLGKYLDLRITAGRKPTNRGS